MPRPRIHASPAVRVAAHRERKRQQATAADPRPAAAPSGNPGLETGLELDTPSATPPTVPGTRFRLPFILEDDDGRALLEVRATADGPVLELLQPDGRPGVTLAVTRGEGGLLLHGERANALELYLDGQASGIALRTGDGAEWVLQPPHRELRPG